MAGGGGARPLADPRARSLPPGARRGRSLRRGTRRLPRHAHAGRPGGRDPRPHHGGGRGRARAAAEDLRPRALGPHAAHLRPRRHRHRAAAARGVRRRRTRGRLPPPRRPARARQRRAGPRRAAPARRRAGRLQRATDLGPADRRAAGRHRHRRAARPGPVALPLPGQLADRPQPGPRAHPHAAAALRPGGFGAARGRVAAGALRLGHLRHAAGGDDPRGRVRPALRDRRRHRPRAAGHALAGRRPAAAAGDPHRDRRGGAPSCARCGRGRSS